MTADGTFFTCNPGYYYNSDSTMCIQGIDTREDGDHLRTRNILYNLQQSDPVKAAQTDYILPMIYAASVPVSIPSVIFPTAVSIIPPNAIITATTHGIPNGANVYLAQFQPYVLNGGPYTVTVTGVNTFTIPTTASAGTPLTIGNVTVETLPRNLSNALANCVTDNKCKYIGYDFMADYLQVVSNTTYAIDTSVTGGRDSSVFTKNGIQNITTLIAPPGYTYQPNFASYQINESTAPSCPTGYSPSFGNNQLCTMTTTTSTFPFSTTVSVPANTCTPPYVFSSKDKLCHLTLSSTSLDQCAEICNKTPGCQSFNHDELLNLCQIVPGTPQLSTNFTSGYIGFIKEVINHFNLPNNLTPTANLSSEGDVCMNYSQCNFDMNVLVYSNVQAFTTNDLGSCAYCPVRSYEAKPGQPLGTGNVTTEIGTFSSTPQTLKDLLIYKALGNFKVPPLIDGGYTMTPWIPDSNFTFNVFVYKQKLFIKDSNNILYSSIPFVADVSLNVVPTTYVSNGYTLYVPGRGMLYITKPQAQPCPKYSVYSTSDKMCHVATFDEIETGVAEYNYGIFIFTPRQDSVGSFFNGAITSNTYITSDSGEKFAITLGAPNFKTYSTLQSDIIIPSSANDPNCQPSQADYCRINNVKFSSTAGLEAGSTVNIGSQTFTIMQTPTNNQVSLGTKFDLVTSNIYYKPDTVNVIQTSINRRYFPKDFDGSVSGFTTNMFDFYQDVSDQPWTELKQMYTQIRSVSFDAGSMPDPYEQYGLFRTLALPALSPPPVNMTATDVYPVESFYSTVYAQYIAINNDSANWGTVTVDAIGNFKITKPQNFTNGMTLVIGGVEYKISSTNGTTVFSVVLSTSGAQASFTAGRYNGSISVWDYGNVKASKLNPNDVFKFPYWSRDRFTAKTKIQNADGFLESAYGCPGGYYIFTKNKTQYCEVCPAGTYSSGGHTVFSCTQCTIGNYCPKGSFYDGPQCAAGYFCPDTKTQYACPRGYFCPAGTVTPISCDTEDTKDGTFVTVPLTNATGGTTINVTGSGFNFVDGMVAGLSPLVGFLKMVSFSSTFASFTPSINQNFSSLGHSLTYHTKAHFCPINSSNAKLCDAGYYCPDSSSELNCPSGSYCAEGVYKGKQCPAGTYYRAPQISSLLRGQANSDGSQCYTCPPGITTGVNSTQDGCICADTSQSWSLEEELCLLNCPAGQYSKNSLCIPCPADTFTTGTGPHASCSPCPDNFISGANTGHTGCNCSNVRHDVYRVPGTVVWNSDVNRCQIQSCNPGYTNFWSNCVPNNVLATPIPYRVDNCKPGELKWNGDCYTCNGLPPITGVTSKKMLRLIPPISQFTGQPYYPPGQGYDKTLTWDVGFPVWSNAYVSMTPQTYYCPYYTNSNFRDYENKGAPKSNADKNTFFQYSSVETTQCEYRVDNSRPMCNYTYKIDDGALNYANYILNTPLDLARATLSQAMQFDGYYQALISCPPCFTPKSTNDGCVFTGGTDSTCFECKSPTINYKGTGPEIYKTSPTGNQCTLSGSLPIPTQYFLWGNDGATPQNGTNPPWNNLYAALQSATPTLYFNPAIDGTHIYQRGYDSQMKVCPAGSYCIGDGTVVDCPKGYYCPPKSIQPTPCTTPGTYCPPKSSAPLDCPMGSYCPTQISAIYCPGGTFNSSYRQFSQSACLTCTAGTYCPAGSATKLNCIAGTYCPTGSSTSTLCPSGFYCPTPSTKYSCPAGYSCPEGTSWNHTVCNRYEQPVSQGASTVCNACPVLTSNQILDPSSWTIKQKITLPVLSLSANLIPSNIVISSCYQKTVRVSNVLQNLSFIATVKSIDSNNVAQITDVPAYMGNGSADVWTVTPFGCDTIFSCTGHSSANPDSTSCSICPLPEQGTVWTDSTGCGVTQCPNGPYSTVTGTSTDIISRPIMAPLTMNTNAVFDIGYQVLVYNSKNTNFIGTVGISTPTQVIFNNISDVTCDFQNASYNDWTLQQYGCKYVAPQPGGIVTDPLVVASACGSACPQDTIQNAINFLYANPTASIPASLTFISPIFSPSFYVSFNDKLTDPAPVSGSLVYLNTGGAQVNSTLTYTVPSGPKTILFWFQSLGSTNQTVLSCGQIVFSTGSRSTKVWYHMAFSGYFYLNGTKITNVKSSAQSNTTLTISPGIVIQKLRVYSTSLTALQISEIYNAIM